MRPDRLKPLPANTPSGDWYQVRQDCLTLSRKLVDEGWDRLRVVRLLHLLSECASLAEIRGRRDIWHVTRSVAQALQPQVSRSEPLEVKALGDILAPLVLLEIDSGMPETEVSRPLLPRGWALVLLDDEPDEDGLFGELEAAGISVDHRARAPGELESWLQEAADACLVVINLATLEASQGMEAFRRLRERLASRRDLVCLAITQGQPFTSQLAALRAGVDVFLERPVTASRLGQALEDVVWKPDQPYRVMLVDDEQSTLNYVSGLLENEGIRTVGLSDPLMVMDFLADFDPDVLLVDIEMPVCKGTELVTLLRQKDRYAHIPVIYLTAWDDQNRRMAARVAGGEDFLTKPVDPDLLKAAVVARARRQRRLHQMERLRIGLVTRLEQFRHAVDQHAIVSMTDAQGRIIFANQQFCDVSGYSLEQLLGRTHRLLKSGEHDDAFYREMWQIISSGRVWRGEIKNRSVDGRYYWVKATIVPLVDAQGEPRQYYSIRTDITEQRFRQQLMEARAAIAAQAGDDLPSLMEDIVLHAERLLPGTTCAIHLMDEGKAHLLRAAAPNLPTGLAEAMDRLCLASDHGCCVDAVCRGEVVVVEDIRQHADGPAYGTTAVEAELPACWAHPIRSPEGSVLGSFSAFHGEPRAPDKLERLAIAELADVCGTLLDRVRQRDALRRREATTSGILRTTSEGFLRVDGQGLIQEVNPALARIVGWSPEAMLGRHPGEFVAPEFRDLVDRMLADVMAMRSVREDLEVAKADGGREACTVTAAPLLDENGAVVGAFALLSDISTRKRLENTLRVQAQILSMVRQGMETYVGTRNLKATTDFLLDGLLRLTGSEYGFIGEVLSDAQGHPYLRSHSLTDISWNPETQALYRAYQEQGMEFRKLDTLFGHVMTSGEMVVSDDPGKDPRRGGLPPGHPPLRRFLGMPVYYGDELVGLYGLANRPDPYDAELLTLLAPFNASYAAIIAAHRAHARQQATLADLRTEKERAESASRAKSEFLANMSHELRTPLNAILGFSQLIDTDDRVPEESREMARDIGQAGEHLLGLINDLLDLAKIEAGRLELGMDAVPLNSLLRDCISLSQQLSRQRNIPIHFEEQACARFTVFADRMRLKQVLLNLISNAIKYNRPGGEVRMECVLDDHADRVRILVRDTGKGIAKDKLSSLFAPFERLGAEKDAIQGTGIGLVISRHLARMMGGDVKVTSEENVGSEFWVELPLPRATAPEEDSTPREGRADDARGGETASAGGKVLYVEDNPVNLKLMEMALSRRRDIQLVSAVSAEAGLELAARERPDLILLDINLPGMDGYEGLAALKGRPDLKGIPVVAVTANAMKGDRERGLAAGFVDYLTKPFKVDELYAILDTWLGGGRDR